MQKRSTAWYFIFIVCLSVACSPRYNKYYYSTGDRSPSVYTKPAKICGESENYSPDTFTGMRYLRVNFHFMYPSDSSLGFSEKEARNYIKELMNACNYKLEKNTQMNLPEGNNTPVLQTKYRIVLAGNKATGDDGIYFHYDDSACWFDKPKKSGLYSLGDKTPFKYAKGEDSILNIYFINMLPDSATGLVQFTSSASGASYGHNIKIFSAYQNWDNKQFMRDDGTRTKGSGFYAGLVNHEIGHSMGLGHTWKMDDGCEDTPKNPGCWEPTGVEPCIAPTSNNLMDYNGCQCALTPCQLGRVHYNFFVENSSQRQVLINTWCDYDSLHPVVIPRNDTVVFTGGREFGSDLIIEEGATLTVQCILALPANAKIIIKPFGKLIVDGGVITNRCGGQWKGIELWETKKQHFKGSVEIINNGSLENIQMPLTQ